MENPTQPNTSDSASLGERLRLINTTADRLSKIIIGAAKAENAPAEVGPLVSDLVTLLKCGLVALTEIADAQQRIAATAEADIEAAVTALADEKAERIATELSEENSRRSFIGKKG